MINLWILPVLFVTGLAAGWMDAIAGGGGLITIPVLLNLGLPAPVALGTNKLQATFGSSSATWHYGRAGLVDYRQSALGVWCTAAGAIGGALAVQCVSPAFLKKTIPVLLVLVAGYFWRRPQLGMEDARPRMSASAFHVVFGLVLGFYDGFLGPGTGSFWAMAYVLARGFNLTKATAHTKLMNFTSNAASLLAFVSRANVLVVPGLVMGAGQLVGARLGAQMVIRRGARFIRPIYIGVVLAMVARLIYLNVAAN